MKFPRDKFDSIIFDMDGVITSEYIYWDSAALTVYELLYSCDRYGSLETDRRWCYDNYSEIRRIVFDNDKTILAVKSLGVNTNWDLAYIVFCVSKYLNPELREFDEWHFQSVRMFIENITAMAPELYELIGGLAAHAMGVAQPECARGGEGVWSTLIDSFQRWFLGGADIPGLNRLERPILSIDCIRETLGSLRESGIRLGIGTGRLRSEIMFPLQKWDLLQYFDPGMIVTYDEVAAAENRYKPKFPISKPHPFVFLKAALGEHFTDGEILARRFDSGSLSRCAVVGDAPSDFLAARAADMKFVGVLTGVDRASAIKYFNENKADYIFEDMTGLGR